MLESVRRHPHFPLLVLALIVTGASSASQAHHLHHHSDNVSARVDEQSTQLHGSPRNFAASIDGVIRACDEQAAALQKLPPDAIVRAVQLNDDQRAAFEQARSFARNAAKTLDASCPKNIPVELGAKLDALLDVLNLLVDSLSEIRPAVLNFQNLLDDEQKGRLVAMSLSEKSQPTGTQKNPATGSGAEPDMQSICNQWVAILRTWPARLLDTGIELSDIQRAALYELSAAIYRSAAHLVDTCPADNPVTALGRLDARHSELQAVRRDVEAIRPSTATFENALNESQKGRLAETTGSRMKASGDVRRGDRDVASRSSSDSGIKVHPRGQRLDHVRSAWFGFAVAHRSR